jgi:hypothetical protein
MLRRSQSPLYGNKAFKSSLKNSFYQLGKLDNGYRNQAYSYSRNRYYILQSFFFYIFSSSARMTFLKNGSRNSRRFIICSSELTSSFSNSRYSLIEIIILLNLLQFIKNTGIVGINKT